MGSMNEEVREPSSAYKTQSEDTSYEIERKLIEADQRLSPWEKAERFSELCRFSKHLAMMGIYQRHPNASEEEIRMRLNALFFDRETMIHVFGWDPEEKGY